jgi:hypothetical protein
LTDHTASQGEVHVLLPSLAPRAKASKARQPGDLVPEKCRENHGFSTFNTNQTLRIAGFFGLIHKPTRMLETKKCNGSMGKSSSRPKTFSEHKFLVHNSNASRINPLNQHFGMVPPTKPSPMFLRRGDATGAIGGPQ